MFDLASIGSQILLFLPLALGISISFNILRATDMTLDGSFVLGAATFAKLISLHYSPLLACSVALFSGCLGGFLTALIQRNNKVDALLAGILAVFILSSVNLIIMGKPNINLLGETTLFSTALSSESIYALLLIGIYTLGLCGLVIALLYSRLGLYLRAFGDNPELLKRKGAKIEVYRLLGFGLTNLLAAAAGCFTAQNIGYADIGMGFGMTLTGIGAIILGQQCLTRFYRTPFFRAGCEFLTALLGVTIYFLAFNFLLQCDVDPIYLKMVLGLLLIFFLRSAKRVGVTS